MNAELTLLRHLLSFSVPLVLTWVLLSSHPACPSRLMAALISSCVGVLNMGLILWAARCAGKIQPEGAAA